MGCQVEILPVFSVQYVWFPTPPPSPRLYPVLTTSSILCMPSVLSSTGTSEKVWRKENSLRLVKILLLLRRITKRLVLRQQREKAKKRTSARDNRFFTESFVKLCLLIKFVIVLIEI